MCLKRHVLSVRSNFDLEIMESKDNFSQVAVASSERGLLQALCSLSTTVRCTKDCPKCAYLYVPQSRYPSRLEANLWVPESFVAARRNCTVVYYLVSPFLLPEQIMNGQSQLITPALEGTGNILSSVNETRSVTEVVLIPTFEAILGDYIPVIEMENLILWEKYFNTSSAVSNDIDHYSKARTKLERYVKHNVGGQRSWSTKAWFWPPRCHLNRIQEVFSS